VPETVSDIGELHLIKHIREIAGEPSAGVGIGDDAAVIDVGTETYLLATTDALADGVHFLTSQIPARSLGRKAIAVNLSDIAAMGGIPTSVLVSLALPASTPVEFVHELYRGMRHEADTHGATIVGGNITSTPGPIAITVTVLGSVSKSSLSLRTGAQIGDVLATTGTLGNAAAARLITERSRGWEERWGTFVSASQVPTPRLKAASALATVGIPHAMLDISDGLASEVRRIGEASGVGALLHSDSLPISEEVQQVSEELNLDPLDLALYGGEDYELLVALSRGSLHEAEALLAEEPLHVVGEVVPREVGFTLETDGKSTPLAAEGWTHF